MFRCDIKPSHSHPWGHLAEGGKKSVLNTSGCLEMSVKCWEGTKYENLGREYWQAIQLTFASAKVSGKQSSWWVGWELKAWGTHVSLLRTTGSIWDVMPLHKGVWKTSYLTSRDIWLNSLPQVLHKQFGTGYGKFFLYHWFMAEIVALSHIFWFKNKL